MSGFLFNTVQHRVSCVFFLILFVFTNYERQEKQKTIKICELPQNPTPRARSCGGFGVEIYAKKERKKKKCTTRSWIL